MLCFLKSLRSLLPPSPCPKHEERIQLRSFGTQLVSLNVHLADIKQRGTHLKVQSILCLVSRKLSLQFSMQTPFSSFSSIELLEEYLLMHFTLKLLFNVLKSLFKKKKIVWLPVSNPKLSMDLSRQFFLHYYYELCNISAIILRGQT